jgi:lipopolysaccharide export system protein LptA
MKKLFSLILLYCSILSADDALYLSSGLAEYKGQVIHLTEDVFLDHSLGKINAKKADLMRVAPEAGLYFQVVNLKGDINIIFKDQGFLNCHRAEINCITSEAKFYGSPPIKKVVYNDNYEGDEIVLKSKQMNVKMHQGDEGNYYVKNVIALNDVISEYSNEYIVLADQAIYNRLSVLEDKESVEHPGTIYLLPLQKDRFCTVKRNNGDIFESKTVCLDASKKTLLCDSAFGQLHFNRDTINFQAGVASWIHSTNRLTLRDNVIIESSLAKITSEKKIEVQRSGKNWDSFRSFGKATYTYNDEYSGKHILTTLGEVFVDYDNLEVSIEKSNLDNRQVFYTDRVGNIRADTIKVEYSENLKPHKITLKGDVCMVNDAPFDQHSEQLVLQYALADAVEYFPEEEFMLLWCVNGKKVLFYDQINEVQVSAASIEYKRDDNTSHGAIKGVGNVCIKLSEEELEKIKQRFL